MADKEKLVVFDFEVPVRRELYERRPILIIADFLQCFDSEGRQIFDVPQHVLLALAERFRRLMDPDVDPQIKTNSLDQAFGGRVARQRNALMQADADYEAVFAHIVAQRKAKGLPKADRSRATPFEVATAEVADEFGTSEENVRRKYKKAGKR